MKKYMRTVFMGSPEFAACVLGMLAKHYPIIGVVTQPDRPAGRGQVLTPPPVKTLALELGLEVIQPERLRRPEAFELLARWAPDLIIVAAYGQILRQNVLDLPRYGCINIHGSLLPRWRGAAPIQAALLNGDLTTGPTIMRMDAGVDTGDMLATCEIPILPEDNAATLTSRMAAAGAKLLVDSLPDYLDGSLPPIQQDHSLATFAPMLKKEEGELDLSQPAQALANRVRAFNPWPGAFLPWQGQPLKIHAAHPGPGPDSPTGSRAVLSKLPAVRATDGWLILDQVQPAGKKAMSGRDFLAGARAWQG